MILEQWKQRYLVGDEMKAAKGASFHLTAFEWNSFSKLRFHVLA